MIPIPELLSIYLQIKGWGLTTQLLKTVAAINEFKIQYQKLSDDELREQFRHFRAMVGSGVKPEDTEVCLFAIIREFTQRKIGVEHFEYNPYIHPDAYDEQLLAALVMRRGKIIQMNTGEGKTLVAPYQAIMDVLYGKRVIILSPNDHLSWRDAHSFAPLYQILDIKVSVVQPGMSVQDKMRAYQADVIYVSTEMLIFDFLRKNHSLTADANFPIPHDSIIIDEIDNVLMDQGSTHFQLVNPVDFDHKDFVDTLMFVRYFHELQDYTLDPLCKDVTFTMNGYNKITEISERIEMHPSLLRFYLKCAISAVSFYEKGREYLIKDKELIPIDSTTGRPHYGSSFEFGIQQSIEFKERVPLSYPNSVLSQITIQSFISRFKKISGMSGSAIQDCLEFKAMYHLDVIIIPPHKPCIRADYNDSVFAGKKDQIVAVVIDIQECVKAGRPVLVGTTNVRDAKALESFCSRKGIPVTLLTAENHFQEAEIIKHAGVSRRVTIVAKMAGRGVDIRLDDAAKKAGGLHVIGMGRSEMRRLDEQIKGRAGRQGDPGSSHFIISLEDDLLQTLGGVQVKKIMDRFGFDDGDEIQHPWITRAIRNAQRRIVIVSFYRRQTAFFRDEYLNRTRTDILMRRETLADSLDYSYKIPSIINQAVETMCGAGLAQNSAMLHELSHQTGLIIPPAIWSLQKRDKSAFATSLKQLLNNTFMERREIAGPYAFARERLILLRSIDYCWTLFIDQTARMVDETSSLSDMRSRFEILNILARQFMARDAQLFNDIDRTTMYYLLNIHKPEVLSRIKYWRGMGLTVGANGVPGLDDGVPVPEHVKRVYIKRSMGKDLPDSPVDSLLLPEVAFDATRSFEDLIGQYVAELASDNSKAHDIERIRSILVQFGKFTEAKEKGLEQVFDMLSAFIKSLKTMGIGFAVRRQHRAEIIGFYRYLCKHGNIRASYQITLEGKIKLRMQRIVRSLNNPMLYAQVALLTLAYLVFYYISQIPIAGFQFSHNPFMTNSSLDYLVRLVDQLFLCSSLSHVSYGLLGIMPYLAIRFVPIILSDGDSDIQFETPMLYAPAIFFFSVLATGFLILTANNAAAIPLTQKFMTGGSIFMATAFITLIIWSTQYLDLIGGVQVVILGNFTVALFRMISRGVFPVVATETWLYFFACASGFVLYILYYKYSYVQLEILASAKFDFEAGHIRETVNRIRFNTFYGGSQYLISFTLIVLLSFWFNWVLAWLRPGVSLSLMYYLWQPAVFVISVWLLLYKKMRFTLGVENVTSFLRKRDLFLKVPENFKMDEKVFLRQKFMRIFGLNIAFELAIISLIVGADAYLMQGKSDSFLIPLFFLTFFLFCFSYFLRTASQLFNAMFSSPGHFMLSRITLSPHMDTDANDSFMERLKAKYKLFKRLYSFVGHLLTISSILTVFLYCYRWVMHMIHRFF